MNAERQQYLGAELITEVEILKNEAKLARDDADYAGAIDALREAIDLTSGWRQGLPAAGELDETDRKIAWHLADCFGMLGGNYRRSGKVDEAIECFEQGRVYELDARFHVASSYNTVNAIVAPIEAGLRDASSQSGALRAAIKMLEGQIFDPSTASRRLDRWAWADLGQATLLLGDLEASRDAYRRFVELSDAASIKSSRDVLRSLHRSLVEKQDDKASVVEAGIAFL
ncbi:MAG: hypothetical protein ACHQAY_00665 [Hyphomicrobiales bacterium]